MDHPPADELREARRPVASLLGKSEKALDKLTPGTWQHTALRENVKALRIVLALMDQAPHDAEQVTPAELEAALRALGSMAGKAEKARSKFSPGTSHHTLQRDRLQALLVGEVLLRAELHDRDAAPGTPRPRSPA